jgi:hypothetical protein
MKKTIYTIFILLISLPIVGQLSPQTKNITETFFPDILSVENVTPALKKEYGYTNYKELWDYLNDLKTNHANNFIVAYIGETQNKHKIPMVVLSNPNQKEKIKVWMQGGLHGDESASTEGMLYLIHQLLNNEKYKHILDDIELAIVPMANIDGYLKQDRYAANGLDLNRDQTKLMAPESVVLKNAFVSFNPEVALDFHEFRPFRRDFAMMGDFGLTTLYDAMFLNTGNLNVPENLRNITNNLFVENAKETLKNEGFKTRPYISTADYKGDVIFNEGSLSSRSSVTNYSLTNVISTLLEVRGVGIGKTSFKRRVFITFSVAISYLETAIKNKSLVKEAIQKANNNQKENIVVTHKRPISKDKIQMIDLNTEKIIDVEILKRSASNVNPALVRKRPMAYYLDEDQKILVEKMRILGVEVYQLEKDEEKITESFTITYYDKDYKKYEQMNQQEVEAKITKENKTFKKGTYKVMMNQKRANLVIELLEPEAPNSFVSFGLLKTEKGATLPIYRILN